jgi:hypothetical protein
MVNMLTSSLVDHRFESGRVKQKTIKLVLVAYLLPKWNNMSNHGLLFQWASTIKIQLTMLQSGDHYHLVECNLVSH